MWPLDSEQPTHALGMAVVVRLLETVFDFPKLFRVTNHIHSWGGGSLFIIVNLKHKYYLGAFKF